jgi:hypothetical protein
MFFSIGGQNLIYQRIVAARRGELLAEIDLELPLSSFAIISAAARADEARSVSDGPGLPGFVEPEPWACRPTRHFSSSISFRLFIVVNSVRPTLKVFR